VLSLLEIHVCRATGCPMSFRVGETVGPYRIVSLLGTGGVGRVFKVKHTVTGRVEAMKVLLQDYTASSDQTKRFRREIQLQASLQHPNIASVHNALWVEDTLVMIMELVPGDSLGRLHQEGQVPLRVGLDYHYCPVNDSLTGGNRLF